MKRFMLFLCTLAITFTGCANLPIRALPSVCDTQITAEGKSYLCEISNKYNIRLEDVGNGIILVNHLVIEAGVYSKEDALIVIEDIKSLLESPISYIAFKMNIYEYIDASPSLLNIMDIYIDEFISEEYMLKRDRKYLIFWLNQNIDLLNR